MSTWESDWDPNTASAWEQLFLLTSASSHFCHDWLVSRVSPSHGVLETAADSSLKLAVHRLGCSSVSDKALGMSIQSTVFISRIWGRSESPIIFHFFKVSHCYTMDFSHSSMSTHSPLISLFSCWNSHLVSHFCVFFFHVAHWTWVQGNLLQKFLWEINICITRCYYQGANQTEYPLYFLAHLHLLLCLERMSHEHWDQVQDLVIVNSKRRYGAVSWECDLFSREILSLVFSSTLSLWHFLDVAPLLLFHALLSRPLVINQPRRYWTTFTYLSIAKGELQWRVHGPLWNVERMRQVRSAQGR